MNIEYADDTVTAANSKGLTCVTEITGEAGSTQVIDSVAGFEEGVPIEYFYFVSTTASSHDQVVCILLKLRAVQLDWLIRGKFLIEGYGLGLLSVAEVPKLQLLIGGLLTCEDKSVVDID